MQVVIRAVFSVRDKRGSPALGIRAVIGRAVRAATRAAMHPGIGIDVVMVNGDSDPAGVVCRVNGVRSAVVDDVVLDL